LGQGGRMKAFADLLKTASKPAKVIHADALVTNAASGITLYLASPRPRIAAIYTRD
jgi:hypothetical protein